VTTSPDLDALAAALGDRVRRDEPLARYTRFGVGGPADLLIVCESVDEVVRAVELARRHGVEWLVLGGGCNVLVADSGVRGLVIINRAARVEVAGPVAWAEAGALLAALARETVERGLAGLEWAAGLPGTVGGAARLWRGRTSGLSSGIEGAGSREQGSRGAEDMWCWQRRLGCSQETRNRWWRGRAKFWSGAGHAIRLGRRWARLSRTHRAATRGISLSRQGCEGIALAGHRFRNCTAISL